ncbi:sperm associated antigen 8 [Centropristis striata]|uniref:sperm associated antigen 8 n=1 Tax=Centropristis striata TaxID=184440 RepID=UPI0027DFAD94|nr:sperm associated antigen 8 [Centropristis striata]
MTEEPTHVENRAGRCMLHNWTEERAVAALDSESCRQIQKQGHRGILSLDQDSRMESVTTVTATFVPPRGPGVRLRGIRGELLEKHVSHIIREQIQSEMNPPAPKPDFCSTTRTDFCLSGFVARTPPATQLHDYKSDPAVTFWSENVQRVQGVTAAPTLRTPFNRSAAFSTPLEQQLDQPELLHHSSSSH